MTQPAANHYPDSDFLKDFARWHREVSNPTSPGFRDGQATAMYVFSLRYRNNKAQFAYRVNRFAGILDAIQGTMPQLVADRIALPNLGKGEQVPEDLLLALLAWYRTVSESKMKDIPPPDWPWVLEEFDRLDSRHQEE